MSQFMLLQANAQLNFVQLPDTQVVYSGVEVTFTVIVDGNPPFVFSWRKGQNVLHNQFSTRFTNSYVIPSAQPNQGGNDYRVVLTDAQNPPPGLASPPFGLTVLDGPPPPFPANVNAVGGDGVVSLSWAPVPGVQGFVVKRGCVSGGPYFRMATVPASGNMFLDTNVVNGMTYYYVIASSVQGGEGHNSPQTEATPMTQSQPPVITQQPVDQAVLAGENVTFTVVATGKEPLSYQWARDGTPLSGADSPTLTLPGVMPNDGGDYTVTVTNPDGTAQSDSGTLQVGELDYGDAPDDALTPIYPILRTNNGASHLVDESFHLGPAIDPELDGQPNADATGDNLVDEDDERGVMIPPLVPGAMATLEVELVGGPGVLNAWIDFNQNEVWQSATTEQVATNYPLANGLNTLMVRVPSGASTGLTFARFRLSRNGVQNVLPYGPAPLGEGEFNPYMIGKGEVEDYEVNVEGQFDLNITKTASTNQVFVGDSLTYSLQVENTGPNTAIDAVVTDSLPAGISYVNATTTQGSVSEAGGLVTWTLGDLPPSALVNLTLTVMFDAEGSVNNCATVTATGTETNPMDNTDCNVVTATEPVTGVPCDQTNKGTNFWLAFPGNYAPDPNQPAAPTLCIIGTPMIGGTVSMPHLGWSTNFFISGDMSALIYLPEAADPGDASNVTLGLGIHVTAQENVAVFAMNQVEFTTDGYLAIPSITLGTQYMVTAWGNVQTVIPELHGSQLAIVACEDNTAVTITLSVDTDTLTAGDPHTVLLNAGETWHLRNTNGPPSDLTGTHIDAVNPVGVFAGHQCANIPNDEVFACDYIVEQLLPANQAGQLFMTATLVDRLEDTFRILATRDETLVRTNGMDLATLNQGEYIDIVLAEAARIRADRPIFVYQFAHSSDDDVVEESDPFITLLPDTSLYLDEHMICVPANGFGANYLNLFVPTSAVPSLSVDFGATFVTYLSNDPISGSRYSAVRMAIPPGPHNITCDEPFGAIVYGWNTFESYGYPSALNLGDNQPPELVCKTNVIILQSSDVNGNDPCTAQLPDLRDCLISVTDQCDPLDNYMVQQRPPAGRFLPVGLHEVILEVQDVSGNIGTCILLVDVQDSSNPLIFCPDEVVANCTSTNGGVVNFIATAQTECGLPLEVQCTPPSGSSFQPGTTMVTCQTTNAMGMPIQCQFPVTVRCLGITTMSSGQLVIAWTDDGVLESSSNVTGPWTEEPGGTSPFIVDLTESQKFYRVRYE